VTTPPVHIDTSKAARRPVRFESPADALADAAALCEAHRRSTLARTGNWTLGQALNHLSSWMTFPFTGYPVTAPPDLAARAVARKPHALRNGLLVGVRIPNVEGGTAAFEDVPPDEALAALRATWDRIVRELPTYPHPFFGELTHQEWVLLHLRHCELHQSFFFPDGVQGPAGTA
jgi:hypothetical protein